LAEQGIDLKPWSGLNETYSVLYALLNKKKGDHEFWKPLSKLIEEIVEGMVDAAGCARLAAPQAELLSSWDIEALVDDLQKALPGGGQPCFTAAVRGFGMGLSAPVLNLFLLLGLTVSACNHLDVRYDGDNGSDASVDTESDAGIDTAADSDAIVDTGTDWSGDCALDSGSVLWRTIFDAQADNEDKALLCACFESLNPSWNAGLTHLFETKTPEQVATALEQLVICCQGSKDMENEYSAETEAGLLAQTLCSDVVIYKGVAFPAR
jgi:hypothetical protein